MRADRSGYSTEADFHLEISPSLRQQSSDGRRWRESAPAPIVPAGLARMNGRASARGVRSKMKGGMICNGERDESGKNAQERRGT